MSRDFRKNPTGEFAWVPEFVQDLEKQFNFKSVPINIRQAKHASGVTIATSVFGPKQINIRVPLFSDHRERPISRREVTSWILVHELAHVARTEKVVKQQAYPFMPTEHYEIGGHDDKFYDYFWQMAKFAKINLEHALDQEAGYKVRSSIKMAKVHGIPGAYKKAREHKERLARRRAIKKALGGFRFDA